MEEEEVSEGNSKNQQQDKECKNTQNR